VGCQSKLASTYGYDKLPDDTASILKNARQYKVNFVAKDARAYLRRYRNMTEFG
jgi:hypothetical protein